MQDYTLSDKTRRLMAREHRRVQSAISVIANQKFGHPDLALGIGKYQGGVCVNGREICIGKNNVMDDWIRSAAVTPEETAVAEAISEVTALVEKGGLRAISAYTECTRGDPLRSMFNL